MHRLDNLTLPYIQETLSYELHRVVHDARLIDLSMLQACLGNFVVLLCIHAAVNSYSRSVVSTVPPSSLTAAAEV